jgi:cyclophilin family peptidyl-prolyl cis-trans isomerase
MMTRFVTITVAALIAFSSGACAQSGAEKGTTEVKVAVMTTNMGTMVFRMFPDAAPKACENMEQLAEKGYYDGIIFHRVIDGFMIQGGDPTGTGYGGRSIWSVPFEDEFSPDLRFDRPGLLAMANSGPKTNGSQFFISLAPTPWLDDKHTIFGEVIEGMDVVEAIGKAETDPKDKPTQEIKIVSLTFETREIES